MNDLYLGGMDDIILAINCGQMKLTTGPYPNRISEMVLIGIDYINSGKYDAAIVSFMALLYVFPSTTIVFYLYKALALAGYLRDAIMLINAAAMYCKNSQENGMNEEFSKFISHRNKLLAEPGPVDLRSYLCMFTNFHPYLLTRDYQRLRSEINQAYLELLLSQ